MDARVPVVDVALVHQYVELPKLEAVVLPGPEGGSGAEDARKTAGDRPVGAARETTLGDWEGGRAGAERPM